jgi:16S rRNA (uracil1498-N3)-methyltransferase
MRRARVDSLPGLGDQLDLPPSAAHHLLKVLRVQPGTMIELFDGDGLTAQAQLLTEGRALLTTAPVLAPRPPELHLILGVLKGPAMDDAIRAATEAGMTHLHAVATSRAVPTSPRLDRWERITGAAAHQCGRADLPVLAWHERLAHAFASTAHLPVRRVGVHDAPRLPSSAEAAAVLIGPEGGLTDVEIDAALTAGFEPTSLGHWTLRACTAAAVGLALTRG